MPYSRLFYHFVWTTYQRLPILTAALREPVFAAIRAKVNDLRGITHALNGMDDHVHFVVTVPPSIALATFIGQVKGVSSHLASRLQTDIPFSWQKEYGVLSLSESHLNNVMQYVINQQKHHAENTLDKRLEKCDGSS